MPQEGLQDNQRVAILTDSCCDLPKELVELYNINVVPLRVVYTDADLRDGVDITSDQVFAAMPQRIPSTSLPFPGDVISTLDNVAKRGFTHVLAVHMASRMSGTMNLVRQVSEGFRDLTIDVIDSKTLSMGLGFAVIEAAKTLKNKANLNVAREKVLDTVKKVSMFFVLETLEYMRRGGRIGRVSAAIGELLNIKPIISFDPEGVAFTHSKVRGRQKSLDKLFEIASDKSKAVQCTIAVMHGGALAEAKVLAQRIKELPNIKGVLIQQIGPVLGVHSGPGLVGICVMTH